MNNAIILALGVFDAALWAHNIQLLLQIAGGAA